ncbi:hypothetical protein Tsp_05252 [Trichinella spiralis]|uniref:hypothetical protein n=1 Tax=Trichinella spiralis TaxID=6334 RepID=UPI0001EFEAC6|nr:hypothetical protein Tsp_05252 [Trichinella spiralis]
MLDYELQYYVNYGVFSQGNSVNKNFTLFGFCNMQTKFRNKCYLNKNLSFTISREIRKQGTWDQAHCCFLIFPYILILFLEKNSNFRTHKWFEAEHNFYLFNTVQRLQHCHDLEANATKEWNVGNIIPLLKVIYQSYASH